MTKNPPTGIITGLQRRLLLLLVAALLPVFGVLTLWSFQQQQDALTRGADNLMGAARLALSGVEKHVEGSRQLLNAVSNGPSLKSDGLVGLCNEFLTNIHRNNAYYGNIGFIDVNGNIVCDSRGNNVRTNVSDREYFQRSLKAKSFAIGMYQIGRVTGRASLPFGMPVYDNAAALKGVAFAALDVEQLARELVDHASSRMDIVMLDRSGTIIGSNAPQGGNALGKPYPDRSLFEALRQNSNTTFEKPDSQGTPTMYATAASFDDSGPGIYVVTSVPRASVTAPVSQALALQLLLITSVAFLGVAVARWIGDTTLVKPARRLLAQINQIGRRDDESIDDQPLTTADQNRDPVGSLSITFDRYAQRLQRSDAERQHHLDELELAKSRLLAAQRIAKLGNWERDFVKDTLWWSEQTYDLLKLDPASVTPSMTLLRSLILSEDLAHFTAVSDRFLKDHGPLDLTYRIQTGDGKILWVREYGEIQLDSNGQPLLASGTVQDVTDQVQRERLLSAETRALTALSLDMPLKVVLEEVLTGLESVLPGAFASVLLVSEDGHVRAGAAPHLPEEFLTAFDGLPIGPNAGSCGAAAFRRETVVVQDIATSELWAQYSDQALVLGLRACWSMPVLNALGRVVATCAVYYRAPHHPRPEELEMTQRAAHVIGIAIEGDRKDKAMRASELRFRNSFQGASAGMVIATQAGRVLEANSAYCRMLGYTVEEIYTRTARDLVHPKDWPRRKAHMKALVQGEVDSFVEEDRYLTKTGETVWIRVSISQLHGVTGRAEGFVVITEDINDQRKTMQALQETEATLNMASRIGRMGAWWVNLNKSEILVHMSDVACEIYGIAAGTVLTKEQAVKPYLGEYAEQINALFERCATVGEPFDEELSLVNTAGHTVWVRSMGEAVRGLDGVIERVNGSIQDISSRKQAQMEQRLALDRLKLLETALSRLNDVVLITEAEPFDAPSPRIVYVNDAFERATGYTREEAVGQSPRFLQGPDTSRAELDRMRAAMQAWEPVRVELVNYKKSGEPFWLELEVVPIADDTGWHTHWVGVQRDITERKQAQLDILELNVQLEDRVERRTAQLAAANKELEAFSYSVSHDLRAPLQTIAGFSQLLEKSNRDTLNDKGKHYLQRIRSSATEMSELIQGMLSLAELSRRPLNVVPVDLTAIAERVAQDCRDQAPDRVVVLDIQPGLQAQGDKSLLTVVIQNLLGNAWKYTAKVSEAHIAVGAMAGDDGVPVYFVKDDGAGFDMLRADKLFGVFQRLHAAADFAGTGVGLANVKRIVERHGGRVWAEGQTDVGASFYFTLHGSGA